MRFCLVLFSTAFAMLFAQGQAEANACHDLASKVCKVFGSSAFHCKAYSLVAKHREASKSRCAAYLARWTILAKIVKRKENYLNQMEALAGRHGAQAIMQVTNYKKRMMRETLAEMTHGRRMTHDPKACDKLAVKVCKSLGTTSMYCSIFTRAKKLKGVQASRCHLLIRNWGLVQGRYYRTQEMRINSMTKKAKTDKQRKKVIELKELEFRRLAKFLTRKR